MKTYLVAYDVCDPKRLRAVYQTMRSYGEHLQLSVFRCELTATGLIDLQTELKGIINHKEDQVLFVDVGPADGRARRAFVAVGKPYRLPERVAVIV